MRSSLGGGNYCIHNCFQHFFFFYENVVYGKCNIFFHEDVIYGKCNIFFHENVIYGKLRGRSMISNVHLLYVNMLAIYRTVSQ